jgi:hypothetical protein
VPEDSEPDLEQEPDPSAPEPPEKQPVPRPLGAGLVGLQIARNFGAFQLSDLWPIIERAQRAQISAIAGSWLNGPAFNLVDTEKLVLPFLPDLTRWIGKASGYARSAALVAEAIAEPAAKVWAQFAPTLELLKGHWLPANLREIDDVDIEDLVSVADDGITLYAVPRAAIAKRILAAPGRAARRRILGRELPRILDDCEAVLDRCVRPETRNPVVFARKSITAARAGHLEASQALVANTLDTTMRRGFKNDDRVQFTSHKPPDARDAFDELAVRKFLVVVPIWHAYSQYTPGQSDPIPWTFNRHVTSHGVNATQFNRPNMAQGVMLLTALIALLNDL